jgi:hypothetical protein
MMMATEPGGKPSAEFRAGTIVAAIWTKSTTIDGRSVAQHSIRIQKRYRDERSGQWKTTTYLRPDELPKLGLVVSKAYEHLTLREVQDTNPAAAS